MVGAALSGQGCTDLGPTPAIKSLTPAAAYSDVAVPVSVDAPLLRSGLVVDLDDESAHYDDGTIHMALVGETPGLPGSVAMGAVQRVLGPTGMTFLSTIPAGVHAGNYGLRVTAPSGRSATLPGAFQELGPDTIPPLVVVDMPMPGATLGIGAAATTIPVNLHVDDGFGELSSVIWSAQNGATGSCPLDPQPPTTAPQAPPSQIKCQAPLVIAPLDPAAEVAVPFSFHVDAIDVAGQVGSADVVWLVANIPSITSFEPNYGPLAGHQAFTIHGEYFAQDAQAFIEGIALTGSPPGNRSGGDVLDTETIVGFTPQNVRPHDATVSVQTSAGSTDGASGYRYTAPPHPRLIQPATGPTTGGIRVTVAGNDLLDGVTISLGLTASSAMALYYAQYTSNDKVFGCLPPGPAGPVTVWANDSVTGTGSLMGVFTYSDDVDSSAMISPDCLEPAGP